MVKIFDRLRRLGLIHIIKDLFGKVDIPAEVDGQDNGIEDVRMSVLAICWYCRKKIFLPRRGRGKAEVGCLRSEVTPVKCAPLVMGMNFTG